MHLQFAVVSDPAAALEVATGPDGVAAGMSEGAPCDAALLQLITHHGCSMPVQLQQPSV
jgi:hypothetical protein